MPERIIDKQCPFYWRGGTVNSGFTIMEQKTRKCVLRQIKDNLQGEPGCAFHGSMPPVCSCLGKYQFTDMEKITPNLWQCPHCQGQITGSKNKHGYNEYDYCQYKKCHDYAKNL